MKKILLLITLLFFTNAYAKTETAIFAGGCFWSMQHDFAKVKGILATIVGYTGGTEPNPTYEQVSTGTTGHYESIKVIYDPDIVSYEQLLQFYWHDIDPTDANGQFCDKGDEYHSAIFYSNASQKKLAEQSKQVLSLRFDHVATQILPAQAFYPAEDYHQNYPFKNPGTYATYRTLCGRDRTLDAVWNGK